MLVVQHIYNRFEIFDNSGLLSKLLVDILKDLILYVFKFDGMPTYGCHGWI